MISKSAPNALIVRNFSGAKASELTMRSGYPFTAQTKANELPVEPAVYSTTVWPGRSAPLRSAPSIIASAIRSLYDPVGLAASSFTHTSASPAPDNDVNRTSGVLPMPASAPPRSTRVT